MKLLITSDNHLGFKETDPIRSEDSFNTFEEILNIAKQENVDIILQSGDLFDENRPSRNTYNKTLKLLKTHSLVGKQQCFKSTPLLNNQIIGMETYLPILSIHGNHDDPSGFNSVSPLDILHSSGLIHYFGRVDSVNEIEVAPILIEGDRKIAIFGIGHIKDRRIQKTFTNKKVIFKRPPGDEYYNILMVHQNRTPREDGYLSEDLIDSFFDLVVYGHEHESIKINHRNFNVIQCGSTIRTSLCEGESMDKYVYILELNEKNLIRRTILETIRPIVIGNIKVTKENPEQQINKKIENLLTEVKTKQYDGNKLLPLFRLRIDISNALNLNRQKIQEIVQGRIANPNDAIRIIRKLDKEKHIQSSIVQAVEIKDIFKQILSTFDMKALIQPKILESLNDFIEKDIKESFNTLVNESIQTIVKYINFEDLVADSLDDAIRVAVEQIKKANDSQEANVDSEAISDDNFTMVQVEELCKTVPNPRTSISFQNSSVLASKDCFTFIEEAEEKKENDKTIQKIKNEMQAKRKSEEDIVERRLKGPAAERLYSDENIENELYNKSKLRNNPIQRRINYVPLQKETNTEESELFTSRDILNSKRQSNKSQQHKDKVVKSNNLHSNANKKTQEHVPKRTLYPSNDTKRAKLPEELNVSFESDDLLDF